MRKRFNEPVRFVVMPGAKRARRLDIDVAGRTAVFEPAGAFPPPVDSTENRVDSIAVAPGVLKSLEYECHGAFTGLGRGPGVLHVSTVSKPLMASRPSLELATGQERAHVAGEIDRPHNGGIDLATPQPIHRDGHSLDSRRFIRRDRET